MCVREREGEKGDKLIDMKKERQGRRKGQRDREGGGVREETN